MLFEIAYLSLFHILSVQMVGGETTYTTSNLSPSGGDISDNCKLICNGGNVTIQIYNDRVSHICIGNSNAPCDWKMEQSDCFKGTAKRIRVLNTATSRFTCNDRLRMNNSCDIKMKCGRPGNTKRCDDCHDCFDKCKTSTSSCNITFSNNGDSAKHITFNGLQVLQKREDNIDNICIDSEWSSWSWTQCKNKIWNQHRYRKCRYPAYFTSIKNCRLSESNYIQCINEDTLENRYTAFPCSWSPWGNCSTSSGTGIQNRTQSICSLSFQNISQCESTAIKMASLCQETHASSTTSWTSMHKKNEQNIIQRFRIDNCANKTINCRWVFYEQIENKSCERNPFAEEQQSSTANPVIGPVIGSVVVLVLVIGGVTVLILVIRRQKQKKDRTAQKTNAVPNATNNTQMDTNAYDDLSKRKSQHVYGIIDLTDQVEAEYSLVEESGIKKDHNNVNSDNYVVLQKEKAQETSEPQEINAEENYFILEKESAMKQSMQQQSDGGDNYFILEKESAMKQSMQQQSDGGDNYFILEKKIAKTNSVK